jgi:hypothetical protein
MKKLLLSLIFLISILVSTNIPEIQAQQGIFSRTNCAAMSPTAYKTACFNLVTGTLSAGYWYGYNGSSWYLLNRPPTCIDSGSTDAYACSFTPPILSYVIGEKYSFKANTANIGAATLQLNSIPTPVVIVKVVGTITTALADNDICAGQWVEVIYDGTNFQMVNPVCNAPSVISGEQPEHYLNMRVLLH